MERGRVPLGARLTKRISKIPHPASDKKPKKAQASSADSLKNSVRTKKIQRLIKDALHAATIINTPAIQPRF
jgi:hypothetical protein